jgi:hypothetical protein
MRRRHFHSSAAPLTNLNVVSQETKREVYHGISRSRSRPNGEFLTLLSHGNIKQVSRKQSSMTVIDMSHFTIERVTELVKTVAS